MMLNHTDTRIIGLLYKYRKTFLSFLLIFRSQKEAITIYMFSLNLRNWHNDNVPKIRTVWHGLIIYMYLHVYPNM